MFIKRVLANRLPQPALSVASKLLHSVDRRFRSLGPDALPVIGQAGAPGDYHEFGYLRGWLFARAQKA